MANKALRPGPTDSATKYPPGTIMKGNDGNFWQVRVYSRGIKKWVKISYSSRVSSQNAQASTTPQQNPSMVYKFNVGDKVKMITPGMGAGRDEIDREVTIKDIGQYPREHNIMGPGYIVDPPIGNSLSGYFNGMIDERSFTLVEPIIKLQKTNPVKLQTMARVKSITKRTTAETRSIETSLINKEEVFKMLALAEATGLPLLLVGDPGVNLN